MANLEKEKLVVRLYKYNKKNEFLRNQFSSQEEKMKSLEQKIAESGAKFDNLSNTKLAVDNKFVSVFVPLKSKDDKVYIPPFKRNHKKNAYFARLDTNKSSDVGAKSSKSMFKHAAWVQKKFVFVPSYHLCSVVGHIRPNCSLLRQKPKSKTRFVVQNTDVSKFVPIYHFCGVIGHIRSNCHKLKFKHSMFQSRICNDISHATSLDKLFHMLLKMLAYERNLQDFSLSQKKCVIS